MAARESGALTGQISEGSRVVMCEVSLLHACQRGAVLYMTHWGGVLGWVSDSRKH